MLLTIEVSVDDDRWTNNAEKFKRALIADVHEQASYQARTNDVTIRRVALVPNRSKSGKKQGPTENL